MPSDQLLAELGQDPRTIAYRADRLAAWAALRSRHAEFRASAEKYGSSEDAAELAADLHLRGELNLLIGELLTHSREVHALEFLVKAPTGWGSRSEVLLDMDSLVKQYLARSYHIVALNVPVASLGALTAEDAVKWRAWLEKLMGQLGAAKSVAHVFDPQNEKPGPNIGKAPQSPNPSPSPTPTPSPSPSPSPTPTVGPWRTTIAVVGGLAVGALVVAVIRR
jgi:hypothetical protein